MLLLENYLGIHSTGQKKIIRCFSWGYIAIFTSVVLMPSDYYPEESFIPMTSIDCEAASEIITQNGKNFADKEYDKRLPYILEARRRVMEQYTYLSCTDTRIESRHEWVRDLTSRGLLLSRRLLA